MLLWIRPAVTEFSGVCRLCLCLHPRQSDLSRVGLQSLRERKVDEKVVCNRRSQAGHWIHPDPAAYPIPLKQLVPSVMSRKSFEAASEVPNLYKSRIDKPKRMPSQLIG